MDIQLATERLLVLEERLRFDELRQRAMDRRTQAFVSGLGSLLQRPKVDDIVHTATQRRIEPFWHVACRARYVYERSRPYTVPVSGPEVQSVAIHGKSYDVSSTGGPNRSFNLPVQEMCREEFSREAYLDGVTGAVVAEAQQLVSGPSLVVDDPETLGADGTTVVGPEQRSSFVVRKLISEMMKPVQADTVEEESIVLEATDLYYRPVYAFEFHWTTRDKKGVLEIDGITGQMRQAAGLLPGLKGRVTKDLLFDIGADTAGMLIPGGSIALKVARAAMEKQHS
ncbi:MAG: hypothetical protein ABIZ34_06575 [Candidatus Limnocylindrales bacterium]